MPPANLPLRFEFDDSPMRYRVRTLLIVLAVVPTLLAGAWGIWMTFGVMKVNATAMTWVGLVTVIALLMRDRF